MPLEKHNLFILFIYGEGGRENGWENLIVYQNKTQHTKYETKQLEHMQC